MNFLLAAQFSSMYLSYFFIFSFCSFQSDASDVDDAEMFAMDDRLAAAFKAMAPKKEKYGELKELFGYS